MHMAMYLLIMLRGDRAKGRSNIQLTRLKGSRVRSSGKQQRVDGRIVDVVAGEHDCILPLHVTCG